MNILITGSSGFIGCQLTACFSEYYVVGVDRIEKNDSSSNKHWKWDISQPIPKRMTLSKPMVIHAAASIDGDMETLWKSNVYGTKHLLDWAVKNHASHIIFFSTGGVYGYNSDRYVAETHDISPVNSYSHTKVMGESLMMMYHREFNIPITILRLFFPYGPGLKRGIFYHIRNYIMNGTTLKINKNGAPKMNPIHIDDVSDIIKKIVTGTLEGFNIFNLCGKDVISFLDLVRLYEQGLSKKAHLEKSGKNCGDLLGDASLIQRTFSWRPSRQISEISNLIEGL